MRECVTCVCAGQAHEAQAYAKAHVCTHYSRWSGKWSLLLLLWRILWSRLDERITGQLSFCTNADTGQRCMCVARQGIARQGKARQGTQTKRMLVILFAPDSSTCSCSTADAVAHFLGQRQPEQTCLLPELHSIGSHKSTQ